MKRETTARDIARWIALQMVGVAVILGIIVIILFAGAAFLALLGIPEPI